MYDPSVGVWLEEDPILFAAGDANLDRYVGNDPTNATDPSGLEGITSFGGGGMGGNGGTSQNSQRYGGLSGGVAPGLGGPYGSGLFPGEGSSFWAEYWKALTPDARKAAAAAAEEARRQRELKAEWGPKVEGYPGQREFDKVARNLLDFARFSGQTLPVMALKEEYQKYGFDLDSHEAVMRQLRGWYEELRARPVTPEEAVDFLQVVAANRLPTLSELLAVRLAAQAREAQLWAAPGSPEARTREQKELLALFNRLQNEGYNVFEAWWAVYALPQFQPDGPAWQILGAFPGMPNIPGGRGFQPLARRRAARGNGGGPNGRPLPPGTHERFRSLPLEVLGDLPDPLSPRKMSPLQGGQQGQPGNGNVPVPLSAPASSFRRIHTIPTARDRALVAEIEASMRQNGWVGDPIAVAEVNGHLYILDGHHRVAAAGRAGIPVRYRVVPPEELARDFHVSDPNRLVWWYLETFNEWER
jgi:hypothetical protein